MSSDVLLMKLKEKPAALSPSRWAFLWRSLAYVMTGATELESVSVGSRPALSPSQASSLCTDNRLVADTREN